MNANDDVYVEFDNVGKSYDGKTLAVDGLDLKIKKGEFITLLGPSGSGKSTTLMMLAGFEAPTKGIIRYQGNELASIPSYKRNFGMVFQNYALFPHMSVLDNVAFPLELRKFSKKEAADLARKALDKVKLGAFYDRRPSQLSGGQQQRVALARALVFEPGIVLLDEPLGALDKKLREEMQVELKHLHEELGVTFVFVTHDQDEALTMSDRVAVFNDGKIQQIADPGKIYEEPDNSFVATFLGETNMLAGHVEKVIGDRVSVRFGDGSIINAANVSNLSSGEQTQVSIRPERIEVVEVSAKQSHQSLTATKLETIYHGSFASVFYQLKTGEVVNVKLDAEGMQNSEIDKPNVQLKLSERHAHAFPIDAQA